jgi:hypothetical protein
MILATGHRRALMGQAWYHPHAQEARPLVGPLSTAQPSRVARKVYCIKTPEEFREPWLFDQVE